MIDWLLDPLSYTFIRNALVVCTIAGALCGLLGVYVTLKGMSFIGHGLSHAIFGGAALCAAIGVSLFAGAALWGLGTGVVVSRITRRRAIGADAAIGVVTTASFAFGIALLGLYTRVKQSIEATLFGSVLGVSVQDVVVIAAITVATVVAIIAFYRPLLFVTFDADVAETSGLRTGLLDALLMLMLCLAILASMQVLGVTLIAAALVIPPVTARLLTNSFSRMLWLSTGLGATAGLAGMYLSYHLDISSGATIVLVNFLVFAVTYATTGPVRHRRAHRTDDRTGDTRGPVVADDAPRDPLAPFLHR